MKNQWRMKVTSVDVEDLSKNAKIDKILSKILATRGINNAEQANNYLAASLKHMYDPYMMKDMDLGTDIILEAIDEGTSIVVYGDYDADGVTSTTILYKALSKLDANVDYYIPDREHEGYGMSCERIKTLYEKGVEIILTCDNGISAIEEVEYAKSLGMTVIITDHHELRFIEKDENVREYILPEADAIINPKQKDCTYPFKLLCGAGIALKFATVLYEKLGIEEEELNELIEIAGIGTICDVVDLLDENRIIAKNALRLINNTNNMGLQALIQELGLKDKTIKSYHIGFMIGPCINATGRLDTANISVELLLASDMDKAMQLAEKLSSLNKIRQDMTNKYVEEIIEDIENSTLKNDRVIVVYKKDLHESIAGIVAGKVREKYNLPTIILTGGKDMPKGSGRSIDEYNMFEELLKCKDVINKFGGHPMAAGLSLLEENIPELRKQLLDNCQLSDKDIEFKIKIDKRIHLKQATFELIEMLDSLEPFGKGNPSPVFAEKNVFVTAIRILGKNNNTLKLTLKIDDNNTLDAIAFNKVDEFIEILKINYGDQWEKAMYNPDDLYLDIVFTIGINEFNGNKTKQLRLTDFRLT
ncbi:single-stranded-DNA-specific exonuclease RecJ [Clostridium grantii]|uniref:Single-stranded-DNA-specific exonuclease RecJ n=1 Tax=Clostridium grantii DSM 8605 TaxID=1121316 RepID=A0A1M5QR38_9CLOT|nr:single-stranded-DNA-specific exonuclease RecJ [Clostridium grantii]SHH16063.1 exonuclease RecJ [Clostridium grantii DSM 8605]